MKNLLFITLLIAIFSLSCTDNLIEENQIRDESYYFKSFAKSLSLALNENPTLRKIIKEEALKKFDNDYDVLYQSIRYHDINGRSLREILLQYFNSESELIEIEERFPLLTVFVPSLPNFNPNSWNVDDEVPHIALAKMENNEHVFFDNQGKMYSLDSKLIPGFPVLVLKNNERVEVANNVTNSRLKKNGSVKVGDFQYYFKDEIFNGKNFDNKRLVGGRNIDQRVIDAYNIGVDWHRDYIYYGLTATNTKGPLNNNYAEYITSFRLLDGGNNEWYNKISGNGAQGVDQKHYLKYMGAFQWRSFWTDGNFEFKVVVQISAINGAGATTNKYFTASIDELFHVEYVKHGCCAYVFDVENGYLKTLPLDLKIETWDLESYGMGWKFTIYEEDPSQQIKRSETKTTEYATNFSISGKQGLKFGGSAKVIRKQTFEVLTFQDSDELGNDILTFDDPVITGKSRFYGLNVYQTKELNTGWCAFSVEPRKQYNR